MKTTPRPVNQTSNGERMRTSALVLGVDGGGTKTLAVVVDRSQAVVGEGVAGPSNPLRVGIASAAAAVREAVNKACDAAGVERTEIAAAGIGLAGVRRKDLRARVHETLTGLLGIGLIEVVSDADIALYGATDGGPGVVVIAGTGSICCGRGVRGRRACAGGWGPLAGDEGSGAWIARRALQAIAHAADGRGCETELTVAACDYFNVGSSDDISTAIYAPNMTNDRIAGFGRYVIEAAQSGDEVARKIVAEAGSELGDAACAVISKLKLEREKFRVAYVGGVFTAGDLVFDPLREKIKRLAPEAYLARPLLSPAVAAARMVRERSQQLALAG